MIYSGVGWVEMKSGYAVDVAGTGFPIKVPLLIPAGALVRGVHAIVSGAPRHDMWHRPFFSVSNQTPGGQIDTMGSASDDSGHDEGVVHQFGLRFDGFAPADVAAGTVSAEFYGEVGSPGTTIYSWLCDYEQ